MRITRDEKADDSLEKKNAAYDYNTAYVSVTDILGLTGAEWTFDGNALYITVKGGAGLPEQTDVSYGEPGGK